MKKRKELNALIGLGDSKRKKTKKGSGHRLLRTEPPDSESDSSSDDDDFNGMNGGVNFGNYTQCCNVCYPLFLFIILAACVMACAGLIWMQIALKEDLDSLKEKLHSMESSQKVSSSEIPKLSEDLKNKERQLDDIENGGRGLNKLWSNLTEINRKISLLDSAVNHLKANLKSAADLISLPTTVEELQKSVATIGSTLTSVQHDVKTISHMRYIVNLNLLTPWYKIYFPLTMRWLTYLRKAMSEVNKTEEQHHTWTDEQIHILLSTVADLHQRVASLENGSKQSVSNMMSLFFPFPLMILWRCVDTRIYRNTVSTFYFIFCCTQKIKYFQSVQILFVIKIFFVTDLERMFQQTDAEQNSLSLTYEDLREIFGTSTPSHRIVKCFDTDGDQKYSLKELRAALGL
uniref:EF-hand calcium binding domain 14 n=1 Tax=Pundamilia nyererei TaxID=303518 RepID=A0A3B4G8R8_9CICH